jgi:hypothetical protein
MKTNIAALAAWLCLFAFGAADAASPLKHVILIAMENTNADKLGGEARYIYGNVKDAPYINNELFRTMPVLRIFAMPWRSLCQASRITC